MLVVTSEISKLRFVQQCSGKLGRCLLAGSGCRMLRLLFLFQLEADQLLMQAA